MARCHGCGATIYWVLGRNKAIPCEDAEISVWLHPHPPSGGVGTKLTLITEDGETRTGWVAHRNEDGAEHIVGRESHFAHCPSAKDFRRR